ncbi:hypothetical protein SORBI_3003G385600 [Sorghum bicolor]|uniref:Myb/SANT-like domain-containing protein n=1 Tax=Sorghum bicolor TaxID=4558 RepID=A0A1B6Q7I1_SORBI|nr:hypothetical protein SORBI_3003G385600 [Sorghum bicolor]
MSVTGDSRPRPRCRLRWRSTLLCEAVALDSPLPCSSSATAFTAAHTATTITDATTFLHLLGHQHAVHDVASSMQEKCAMDGDDFSWCSQVPGRSSSHDAFDLNSQVPAEEDFPGLQLYGDILRDDSDLTPVRVRGTGLPPYRPPRVGAGDRTATPAAPYARQLQFGGSSSAAAGRGCGTSAGGVVRQRANSASATPGRRPQRANTVPRGSTGQRIPSGPRPRGTRAPSTTTSTRAVRGQPTASSTPFFNHDAAMEDDGEELGSSGGPPVSHSSRAQWNDANNACLLELCIEQRRAGTYTGSQMSGEGYQAVVDGLLARRGLVYSRGQVKNQIGVLRNTHAFWRYLQVHTGLGRKPDGSIDADHDFWQTHTEKKPYLKKLLTSPPGNEDLLDELFRGYTVDGTTAFVPGDDYGDNEGQDAGTENEEEGFEGTPTTRSSQRSQKGKRAFSSTTSTLTSPVKRTKSPMVKIVKEIASTFKESVAANTKQIQKRANEKAAFSVKMCQELAFECGVEKTVDNVYAMSKLFATEYQREFFCGQLTPELRLGYFKKWCTDNNME